MNSNNIIIDRFTGHFSFLSNFFESPFILNGIYYFSVEHYYQSEKTDNNIEKRKIIASKSAKIAKKLGRTVKLVKNWENIKVNVMRIGLENKFKVDNQLGQMLIATHPAKLKEGNYWHDNFFGSCFCKKCGNKGKNVLGKLLMERRKYLLTL